jgi:hypothetical protein
MLIIAGKIKKKSNIAITINLGLKTNYKLPTITIMKRLNQNTHISIYELHNVGIMISAKYSYIYS